MRKLMVLALSSVAVIAAGTAAIAANNGQRSDSIDKDCNGLLGQKEGTFTYDGVVNAWPPNHKYRTATITLTEDDDADPMDEVTIAVTGSHDQMVDDTTEMNGAGNTDPATDVVPGTPGMGTGSASTTVRFRGERSGRDKTGRTYTFDVMGTTDDGTQSCSETYTATVPHDQRKNQ